MHYYAKIINSEGYYDVSFPQFDSINTYGETLEEAIKNGEEALNGCLESDFERGFEIPHTEELKGENLYKIPVYPHIEIAFQLRRIRKNKSQVEAAKELGISYQAYQRLENPRRCNPTVKTLEKIAKAFDKELEIAIR